MPSSLTHLCKSCLKCNVYFVKEVEYKVSCNLKANTHKIRHKNSWKARKHHKQLFVVFIDMGPGAAEGGWEAAWAAGETEVKQ